MKAFYDKILEWVTISIFVSLVVIFLLLISPVIIIISIWNIFDHQAFNNKYLEFLAQMEGTKFFCYNNRASSQKHIENHLLPMLSNDIKVIFLEGKKPQSEYDERYISKMLYGIQNKKGFPYLLKVSNGQVIDKSVNNEFYTLMQKKKDVGVLIEGIERFFIG